MRIAARAGGVLLVVAGWGMASGAAQAQLNVAEPSQATVPNAPSTQLLSSSTLSGVVQDVGATPVSGADVTIEGPGGLKRTVVTDEDGAYQFSGLPAGEFTIFVKTEGLEDGEAKVQIALQEHKVLPEFELKVQTAMFQVDAISQEQMAEQQIKQEEQQRLLGIMPNFYVVYDQNFAPLTTKQKYKLAAMATIDPVTIGIAGLSAGVQQAQNTYAGYGQGFSGYAKRFGANYANVAVGNFLGGAVFPSWLHQDPRYFYKGTGTVWSRTWYAFVSCVRSKGDNGEWQPAYASVLGDVASGAASYAYYPASDRSGAKLLLENSALSIVEDGLSNVVQEFLLKRFTTTNSKKP
jgi:hypothetical protein